MKYFIDDENTQYDEVLLNRFLEEKNAYGYVAKDNDIIVDIYDELCDTDLVKETE